MDFEKHAYIAEVVKALKARESWSGKTHVQKSLFLLQQLADLEVPFQFVLYKHGPYSFEVETAIEEMKSYDAISVLPVPGYGVVISPSSNAEYPRRKAPLNPSATGAIQRICEWVAPKNVSDLERIATTVWVRYREGVSDPSKLAERVHKLKPHITAAEAQAAYAEAKTWAQSLCIAPARS